MNEDYTYEFRFLMRRARIRTYQALSDQTGIPIKQLRSIRQGKLFSCSLHSLLSLSQALKISLSELISTLSTCAIPFDIKPELEAPTPNPQYLFEEQSLQMIESWVAQWPSAMYAVRKKPQFPAKTLITLSKPLQKLLTYWQVEYIGTIGEVVEYNPQEHQLEEGEAEIGTKVIIRQLGYTHRGRLRQRAKVMFPPEG